jgi:hypothetical protein
MPRRWSRLVLLLAASFPLLLALGGGGAGPVSDTIPRPKDNYVADLLDKGGQKTRVEFLTCGGRTFFPLKVGEGTLMVPFSKVEKVSLEPGQGGDARVRIDAGGAEPLEGMLPRSLLCTGSTEYGNFQVDLSGLQEIRIVRP